MGGLKVKKILIGMMVVGLLAGCGSQSTQTTKNEKNAKNEVKTTETTQKTDETSPKSKYPFPNAAPVGDGKLTVSTPAGSSDGGNVPVLFIKPDELVQIGAMMENFQGDKQTFVYVDKIFNSTEQAGQMHQTSINPGKNDLKIGVHTVTAVQFDNDDPAIGKVINFVEAKYEVKAAK
jgi:uncharacterized lipoprotein